MVASLAALGLVLLLASAAVPASAEISPNGEVTWGVYGLDPDTETDAIDSQVFAIEQIGDRIYVGGKFTEARPSANGTPVTQPYLAAFNVNDGALITTFRPALESAVYALEASPDGSRLFVGGEFTSIDGDSEARGVAALDPMTGAVDQTWRAKTTNTSGARGIVRSLTIAGDQLYLAGRFDRVGGGPRPLHLTEKVARVALADGTADISLSTDVDGGAVWGVAVAPDGSRIYLAGYHDRVDGDVAGADYAVLNASDGRLIPGISDTGGNSSSPSRRYGQDVVAVGDLVFWAGSEHVVRVFRASDGALVREHSTNFGGDFQDLEVVNDRVYGSCHCYTSHFADFDWWTRGALVTPDVEVTPIKYVAAYSAITGEYLSSFLLDASATKAGVWAIHGDHAGCLWVGGDLSRITTVAGNDRAAGGFARFCEGEGGDSLAPDAPSGLTQTRSEDHKVVIRWDGSSDNIGVDHYEISRDGVLVGTKPAGGGQGWFTDAGLDPGTSYRYEVVAVDGAGNVSAPGAIDATTTGFVPGGDVTPPTSPGDLTQTRSENRKIVLRFDQSTDDVAVDHYLVRRDGVEVATVTATSSARRWYSDAGLEPATIYRYEVLAVDTAGNSSAPAVLDAGTVGAPDGTPPAAPTDLRSTRQTRERVVLTWTAPVGATSHVVQRQEAGTFVDVATVSGVWYTDRDLVSNTTYGYRVIGVDAAGLRSAPAELVVSTLP